MLWNIAVNDAGAEYDPLTLLRTRTMFGRPDWKTIYSRMSQAIQSGQYLPGTNAQLKSKVGVSNTSETLPGMQPLTCSHRRTSAVLVSSRRPSRRLARRPTVRVLTSPSPRYVFAEVTEFLFVLTHVPALPEGTLLNAIDAKTPSQCSPRFPCLPRLHPAVSLTPYVLLRESSVPLLCICFNLIPRVEREAM